MVGKEMYYLIGFMVLTLIFYFGFYVYQNSKTESYNAFGGKKHFQFKNPYIFDREYPFYIPEGFYTHGQTRRPYPGLYQKYEESRDYRRHNWLKNNGRFFYI